MEWVAKITTVALEMVVLAVLGQYLAKRWGMEFLGLLGVALGVTVGIWHLLRMTKLKNGTGSHRMGNEEKP